MTERPVITHEVQKARVNCQVAAALRHGALMAMIRARAAVAWSQITLSRLKTLHG